MAALAKPAAADEAASGQLLSPEALVARTGRERQRYEGTGARLVAGCIPIRDGPAGELEVLMVSSRRGEGLIFPKGGWETDETAAEAAARESLEEAGVRGDLQELGSFPFTSKTCRCVAHVFVMRVTEELAVWPERHERRREWEALQQWSAGTALARA